MTAKQAITAMKSKKSGKSSMDTQVVLCEVERKLKYDPDVDEATNTSSSSSAASSNGEPASGGINPNAPPFYPSSGVSGGEDKDEDEEGDAKEEEGRRTPSSPSLPQERGVRNAIG